MGRALGMAFACAEGPQGPRKQQPSGYAVCYTLNQPVGAQWDRPLRIGPVWGRRQGPKGRRGQKYLIVAQGFRGGPEDNVGPYM